MNEFTQSVAIRDFMGNPQQNQLQFRRNETVEVDYGKPPQNGWRLGRIQQHQGWFPEWAVQPVSTGPPPPPTMACPPPPPQHQQQQPQYQQQQYQQQPKPVHLSPQEKMMHQNGYLVSPSSQQQQQQQQQQQPHQVSTPNYSYGAGPVFPSDQQTYVPQSQPAMGDGSFDQRNANIMGGGVPRASTADGGATHQNGGAGTHSNNTSTSNHQNPFTDVKSTPGNNNHFFGGITNMFHNKNKQSPKNNYVNPYTQSEQGPESDWAGNGPQILSSSGKVATINEDGETSHYQNQQSYQNHLYKEQKKEQFETTMKTTGTIIHTTTMNLGQQLGNIKIPTGHGMKKSTDGNTTTPNQQQQQQQQKNTQVIEVNTTNLEGDSEQQQQQQQQQTVGTVFQKFGKNMKKVGRSLSPKAHRSPNKEVPYADADGTTQYITEDKTNKQRQSRAGGLNIEY